MNVFGPPFSLVGVWGCVPSAHVDSVETLTPLVGEAKARAIVRATGFATRRVAPAGTDVFDLALPAAERALAAVDRADVAAVVAVSFSRRRRFPALAAQLQHALGLPQSVAAVDLSMACAGWPYGLFQAAQFAAAANAPVLLVDGDVQSAFVDPADAATVAVMGDAATACVVAPKSSAAAPRFAFFTDGAGGETLACGERVKMDGFGVYRFVAGPVRAFLADFGTDFGVFAPHLANGYAARQLADALGLGDRLVTAALDGGNPGSCSVPLALANLPADFALPTRVLAAGFGAGLAASAAAFELGPFSRGVVEL